MACIVITEGVEGRERLDNVVFEVKYSLEKRVLKITNDYFNRLNAASWH